MADERMKAILMVSREIMNRTKMLEEVVYPTRRKLTRGIESAKGKNVKALTWKCSKCSKVNRPQRRLLATLPVILCDCGEESNVQFDFSLHKIELNDHFLIPIIRKQKSKECCPCSMLSLAEISWRVNAIINGQVLEDSEPCLDKVDMLEKYNHLCDVSEIEKRFDQTAVEMFLEVFKTIGVQSEVSKDVDPKVYKLPFFSAVKKKFSAICSLLADGYVIRTSFYCGKNFSKLKPGKIYKSPGRGRIRHATILIGAGRRGRTNYYHLLNSWGKRFCLRTPKRGIEVGRTRLWSCRRVRHREKALGGFGLIRETDIIARPVTFLRHEDDYNYYKRLLLKDIVPLGKKKEGPEAGNEAIADCCGGFFAGQSSANSGIASFKAPVGARRSSFEQKSNYQTPASALYGAYEGSSSQGSSSSYIDHTAPLSDPVALMEFYAKKAAQEEQKGPPKDEMPPPPSLQGPPKKGHHICDFIPPELEKFMARCNDAAAQKATEAAEKAKTQADNIGHNLLSKMGWREGEGLGSERRGHADPFMAGDVKKDHLGVGTVQPAPPPPPPNDMAVRQVTDKLASYVAKNGRQFENIPRQRNPGDTPFKVLFDKHCPEYKYYEFQLAEEEKALAQSKEAEASKSANSSIASFKAPGGTRRSSFEQKSNYQTPASALYGAYEGSSSRGSPPSYKGSLLEERRNEEERENGSISKLNKKYEGYPINPCRTEALRVA